MQLEQLINATAVATYYEKRTENRIPYVAETLFPAVRNPGLTLEWFMGYNGLPVALRPSALDTQPALRDRIGMSAIQTTMPFFREQMSVREKERQQLLQLQSLATPAAKALVAKIYDDESSLISGALVQAERMRCQLLYSGAISISAPNETGRVVNYDYDFDDSNKSWAKANAKFKFNWSNPATSTPLEDIQAVVEEANTHGVVITRALCSNKMLLAGAKSDSIRKYANPVGYANTKPFTKSDFVDFILRETSVLLVAYDKFYADADGSEHRFWPDNKIAFFPEGNLGKTHFGVTPEEADLANGEQPGVDVKVVETGVSVASWKDFHIVPVNMIVNVSALMLPSFEAMKSVYVATVTL
jgi:hypothetical protein